MIHYAVVVGGRVIGSRSSKSHAQQIYTHALIEGPIEEHVQPERLGVVSYHSSERLALQARDYRAKQHRADPEWFGKLGAMTSVPVAVSDRKLKVGALAVVREDGRAVVVTVPESER